MTTPIAGPSQVPVGPLELTLDRQLTGSPPSFPKSSAGTKPPWQRMRIWAEALLRGLQTPKPESSWVECGSSCGPHHQGPHPHTHSLQGRRGDPGTKGSPGGEGPKGEKVSVRVGETGCRSQVCLCTRFSRWCWWFPVTRENRRDPGPLSVGHPLQGLGKQAAARAPPPALPTGEAGARTAVQAAGCSSAPATPTPGAGAGGPVSMINPSFP